MTIQIKSHGGNVLFEHDCRSVKSCLEAAINEDANLESADLRGVDLESADLRGANLRLSNLRLANLRGANLQRANLRLANLRLANLESADLRGIDLWGAKGILIAGPCDLWLMYAVRHNDEPRFFAGCRGPFTETEARAWWHGKRRDRTPKHDAAMIAGVEALLMLAKAHNWPIAVKEDSV